MRLSDGSEYGYEDFERELQEIKRMEYLLSKAPCIARLEELAAYAAKDEENEP